MFSNYILTGATGFLGNTIAWYLHSKGYKCTALVMHNDEFILNLPPSTQIIFGDLLEFNSLNGLFDEKNDNTCLIHCAGLISISSKHDPMISRINVDGTRNIMEMVLKHKVKKTIYVSSVHALPEVTSKKIILETNNFDEKLVKGQYAKSKATASKMVLDYVKKGLDISIVHPSGIIGPNDWRCGPTTNTIINYCQGKMNIASRGGNNFVDVRDVTEGIISCSEMGKPGECYLLTGHSSKIRNILEQVRIIIKGKKIVYLPLWIVKIIAPIYEKIQCRKKQKPILTPYSAYALGANSNYSNQKAKQAFNFSPRPLEETIRDTIQWLKDSRKIPIDLTTNNKKVLKKLSKNKTH